MRTTTLLLLVSVILPTAARAQRSDELKKGARLAITESGGATMKGSIVAMSADSITVAAERGADVRTIALRDVGSIRVRHVSHLRGLLMGALIGTTAGALGGAIIGASDNSCGFLTCGRADNAAFAAFILGTGGLAAGSVIGAAVGWPTWKTVTGR